jgi:hypothetical protein
MAVLIWGAHSHEDREMQVAFHKCPGGVHRRA